MHLSQEQVDTFQRDGVIVIPNVLSTDQIEEFRSLFESSHTNQSTKRGSAIYGLRNILEDYPLVATLGHATSHLNLVEQCLAAPSFPVRGLYFDKLENANWHLPWHQDLAIAVKEKIPTPGYYGWSMKEGVPHVIPPEHILKNRLALRFHLDDCTIDNGPLQVLPTSHTHGKLSHAQVTEFTANHTSVPCTCNAGDLIIMAPMVLHASSPASSPHHRRVIHIEYASRKLDSDLQWQSSATQ